MIILNNVAFLNCTAVYCFWGGVNIATFHVVPSPSEYYSCPRPQSDTDCHMTEHAAWTKLAQM